MLHEFLTAPDVDRASYVFRKLARHHIQHWALTGGLAIEMHSSIAESAPHIRPLNDVDFIADSFESIAIGLGQDFLVVHVHPFAEPGKIMLQLADADAKLRIDLFRACGSTMDRALRLDLPTGVMRLVSAPDLIARNARLVLDLHEGIPIPSKHATDFLRLSEMVKPSQMQQAWRDHRKVTQPETFDDVQSLLKRLIPASSTLLIAEELSMDAASVCASCHPVSTFQLADRNVVLSTLGYC